MSGHSTPKRRLECSGEDEPEDCGLLDKKYRLDGFVTSNAVSASSVHGVFGVSDLVIQNGVALEAQPHLSGLGEERLRTQRKLKAECQAISMTLLLHLKICLQFSALISQLQHVRIVKETRSVSEWKAPIIFDEAENGKEIFLCPELVLDEDRCNIQSQEGISVAVLNKKSHSVLRSLSLEFDTHHRGLLPKAKFMEKLDTAGQHTGADSSNLEILMSVLVFGLRSIADPVAKALARHRLFLQHPSIVPKDILYENPQYPRTITSLFPNGTVIPPISVSAVQTHTEVDSLTPKSNEDPEDLITVIDNLPRHEYLNEEAEIDSRVKTTLLPHQKEAVDFAMRREGIGGMGTRSLWSTDYSNPTCPTYIHKITDFRSPCADDTLGGILADDMGLGKSLTMIATIVTTMRGAGKSAERLRAQHLAKTSKIPVKSTLITLRFYKYHGPARLLPSTSPLEYDVILTTYGTIVAEFRRGGGVLDCFHWYRLILDEGIDILPNSRTKRDRANLSGAHVVRNWSTKQYNTVTNLSASIRWCLTGTPIQNTLYDLESLLKFLQIPHFDNKTNFRRYIVGKQKMKSGVWKPDYGNLKKLLGLICLRRTTSVLALHGVDYLEHRPHLLDAERRIYDGLAESCKQSIDTAVSNRGSQRESQAVLVALLRLRMFCSAGIVGTMSPDPGHSGEQFDPDEITSLLQQNWDAICTECGSEIQAREIPRGDNRQSTIFKDCLRCLDCLAVVTKTPRIGGIDSEGKTNSDDSIFDDNQDGVPYAIASGNEDLPGHSSISPKDDLDLSKLQVLLMDIKEHYFSDKWYLSRLPCKTVTDNVSIVFSSWRQSLNSVGRLLDKHGVHFCKVDGGLRLADRKKVLRNFREHPENRVLLMTLGTGGVG
ncbi:MAG: hypothetical protein Q9165_008920 [Trypethelium subeluteriae]